MPLGGIFWFTGKIWLDCITTAAGGVGNTKLGAKTTEFTLFIGTLLMGTAKLLNVLIGPIEGGEFGEVAVVIGVIGGITRA